MSPELEVAFFGLPVVRAYVILVFSGSFIYLICGQSFVVMQCNV